MKHYAYKTVGVLLLSLALLTFSAPKASAWYYFGGKVTSWEKQSSCPAVTAINDVLDAVCAATFGSVCITVNYGSLGVNNFLQRNLSGGSNDTHVGVLSLSLDSLPVDLDFYQAYLNFGFTKVNSYAIGQALDFTPSCNPCDNDLLKAVFRKAGAGIDKACNNYAVKAAIKTATAACSAALKSATETTCPTKLLCYVGSSKFGTPPAVYYNVCSNNFGSTITNVL